MRANPILLVVLVACSPPRPARHEPPTGGHYVEFGVRVEQPGGVVAGEGELVVVGPPDKPQPAYIKLRLGHFRNDDRGIGLVIDRTLVTADEIPPAKVRFDDEAAILELRGQRGPSGRLDYLGRNDRLVLQLWTDGRAAVYVFDRQSLTTTGPIDLYRDADADPL